MQADDAAPKIFHHLATAPLAGGSAITPALRGRVATSDKVPPATRCTALWAKMEHGLRSASPAALMYFTIWESFQKRVGSGRATMVCPACSSTPWGPLHRVRRICNLCNHAYIYIYIYVGEGGGFLLVVAEDD